jgi:hypothetical protein
MTSLPRWMTSLPRSSLELWECKLRLLKNDFNSACWHCISRQVFVSLYCDQQKIYDFNLSSSSNFATYSRLLSWMARKCQLKHSLERFVTLEMSLNSWKYNFIRYCSMGLVHGLQLVGILQASVPLEHLVADRQEEHSSDSWVSLSGRHCDGLQVSNCM